MTSSKNQRNKDLLELHQQNLTVVAEKQAPYAANDILNANQKPSFALTYPIVQGLHHNDKLGDIGLTNLINFSK